VKAEERTVELILQHNPIAATVGEQLELNKLEEVLDRAVESQAMGRKAKLVGPNGEMVELPDSIFKILHQLVNYVTAGKAVSLIPVNKELTTQEAADLLNVSRPFLIKLLEKGKIGFSLVGTHRRVRFDELMAYKKKRDDKRSQLLDDMARISQEAGDYD
jgi:excisionase family DNA binding protein